MSERVTEARNARLAAEDVLDRLIEAAREGDAGAVAELQAWEAFAHNSEIDIRKALRRLPKEAP